MLTFIHNKYHAETHHASGDDSICPFSGTFYISGDLSANTPAGYGGAISADVLNMTEHSIYGLSATNTKYGVIRLATNTEISNGVATNVAVTPAGLAYYVSLHQSHDIHGTGVHNDVANSSPTPNNSLVFDSASWSWFITNPPLTAYQQATDAEASASAGFVSNKWISPVQLRREISRQMPAWYPYAFIQNGNTSGSLRFSPADLGYGFTGLKIESSNSSGNWESTYNG